LQTEAQPRNFSKENKVKDYFTNNLINPPKLISNHQNEMNHTFAREIPKLVEQTHLRSKSNTKVNFNYTQNTPNFSVPSFISQAPIIPIFQHPRPIFNMLNLIYPTMETHFSCFEKHPEEYLEEMGE